MKNITIPLIIPSDLLIALNGSEQELTSYFQMTIALNLFQEGKLTLGKAIQLSESSRFEFEKELIKKKIPVASIDVDQVMSDAEKMSDL